MKRILFIACVTGCFCLTLPAANGQQYNSDSYLSKPWGTITIIPTVGKRSSMLMTTYSLFPRWEFTIASYLYNNDNDPLTNDGYSASLYAKYMFYENREKTGGFSAKAGTGTRPGTLDAEFRVKDAFKTYWINTPATIPFFHNQLSVDLMPGVSTTINYGDSTENPGWAFTYSARAAWYPFGPKASVVGEVYGAAGETGNIPEYRIGLRWEPSQYAVFALTYGHEFNGSQGAGIEFGIMLFTPQFACFGGCQPKQKKKNKQVY